MDPEESQQLISENNNINNSNTYNQNEQKIEQKEIIKPIYPYNPLLVFKSFTNLDKNKIIKLFISFIITLAFGLFNNIRIISNPTPHNIGGRICYEDIIHNLTKKINMLFIFNSIFRKIVEICGTSFLDLLCIISAVIWIIYAVDWKLVLSLLLFYGIRGILQNIVRMSKPDLLYFPYPDFPSILTSYVRGSDYFYSGHCGIPIILACEFKWLNSRVFTLCCVFVSLSEVFLMICCRGHYTIDIIVGILMAHYITIISKKINNKIYDYKLFKKLKEENENELIKIGFGRYNQHRRIN